MTALVNAIPLSRPHRNEVGTVNTAARLRSGFWLAGMLYRNRTIWCEGTEIGHADRG